MSRRIKTKPRELTPALLARHAPPRPASDDDKDSRGRVLIVGGCRELPGAVILAARAALRAGAGKLQIATAREIALSIGCAVPESLAIGTTFNAAGAKAVCEKARRAHGILIGPGLAAGAGLQAFLGRVLREVEETTLVLDAEALVALRKLEKKRGRVPLILTPHAGELASLLGKQKSFIESDPVSHTLAAAERFRAVVALKGATTYIATPRGELFSCSRGNVGLATSGSGDTLGGIVAGLAARGATPLGATLWGVWLHARAGERLAKRVGKIGYLASEIPDEIPSLLG